MPFFIPCKCPTGLGDFAVYGGQIGGTPVVSRVKYGFDSQVINQVAAAGATTPNQAARGPVSSYLGMLSSGGNGNVEAFNRSTDARTTTADAWGVTPGQPNAAGPLSITQSSLFHRNTGFTYFPTEVTWATTTYNTLGSFLPGATFAAGLSGCVYKNDQAHLCGEGSTSSNTKWLYDRQLGSFNVNGTIVQSGFGYMSLSGVNNGYLAGGTTGGAPFSTNVRLTYQTGLSVFTTALVSGRGQSYGAWNLIQTIGVFFAGTINNPGNLPQDTQVIRFTFATEANAYGTVLTTSSANTAGA